MAKNQEASCPKVDIGGQAVLDGVMMRGPEAIAIAVRRANGDVVVKRDDYVSPAKKHKWMGLPFIRGTVNMVSMLKIGMQTLSDSANMSGDEEAQEEPTKFEKWLAEKLGKNVDKVVMSVAVVTAVLLSFGLFVALPNLVVLLFPKDAQGGTLLAKNLTAGVVRILILIGYIGLCGKIPDMRKTFQYHGSEHKTVYCHEHELPLNPKNAQQFSTLHPRCGTSFLMLTFILSILVTTFFDWLMLQITGQDLFSSYLPRLARSVVLLPLIMGVGYEALKGLAHREGKWVDILRWPGMQMQRLTTKQPTDAMCQVAIISMKTALNGLPEGEKTPEGWVVLTAEEAEGLME